MIRRAVRSALVSMVGSFRCEAWLPGSTADLFLRTSIVIDRLIDSSGGDQNAPLARKLALGFAGWRSSNDEAAAMLKGLGHMLHREQSRAWRAWQEMIFERAEFPQKPRKGVSFMVNRKLAVSFAYSPLRGVVEHFRTVVGLTLLIHPQSVDIFNRLPRFEGDH